MGERWLVSAVGSKATSRFRDVVVATYRLRKPKLLVVGQSGYK